MKQYVELIFPALSDELVTIISLIVGLLLAVSIILFITKKNISGN